MVNVPVTVQVEVDDRIKKAHEMLYGIARPKNEDEAIQIYVEESKSIQAKNNANAITACNVLGMKYFKDSDINKALLYFQKAARKNSPEAWYRIGAILEVYFKFYKHFIYMYVHC